MTAYIVLLVTDEAGQIGQKPRRPKMVTNAPLSAVTTAGFLNLYALNQVIELTDVFDVWYGATFSGSQITSPGTYAAFTVSVSAGVYTLAAAPGNPSGAVTVGHIAVFDSSGSINDDAATAINGGNIQAGLSGTAGYLASFPATASKGSLRVVATENTGNTVTQITNAAMGQATVLTIPDPAGATGNVVVAPSALVSGNLVKASGTAGLVVDAGARIIANTTGTYAGGGTSNAFTATGLSSSAKGSAVIRTSTNNVSIVKAVPGTNTLTITFSSDPGANTTVDYIYVTAAQS